MPIATHALRWLQDFLAANLTRPSTLSSPSFLQDLERQGVQPPPAGGDSAPRELTFEGLVALMAREIGASCEYPWGVLRAFRYELGSCDGDGSPLRLQPAPLPRLPPRARYNLSRPPALADDLLDPAQLSVAEVVRLDPTGESGVGFIAGLFARFSSVGGQAALSPDDFTDVFSACKLSQHPFGGMYPFNAQHRRDGSLSWPDWLHLWTMLASTQPSAALQTLYELGYTTVQAGTRRLSLDPSPALSVAPERTAHLRTLAARSGCGYLLLDEVAWDVARIAVIGSQGSGKTTAALRAVGADVPNRYAAHVQAMISDLAPADGNRDAPQTTPPHTQPTTQPTHYVRPMPAPAPASASSEAVEPDPAEPRTLVFTVSMSAA